MASAAQPDISSELEKKEVPAAGEEADNNPEEPMDEEDDDNDDGGDGDEGDVEEDVVVQIGATYSCKRQDGSYLNCPKNEWVDKTRLEMTKPMTEDQVTMRMEPESTEEEEGPMKRNEDGSPEAKKVKVDVKLAPTPNSAMASGDFAEELTCLLCRELLEDPVMVECGHNFCRNCVDQAWNGQESFTCPDCKEVTTKKRYTSNRALANLVKKTTGTIAFLTPAKPSEKPKPSVNCPEHDERLKLYCKDDGTLSCIICRDALKHASHSFLPILDAVEVYKTELSAIVAPLEEALKDVEQLTSRQREKVEEQKNNISESRQHIVSEFEKIRSFLKEREEKLLENLQQQGETLLKEMEANMVKLQKNQNNVKQTIAMTSERANDTDYVSFLADIKSFIEKYQQQLKDMTAAENTVVSKDLCRGTFKAPIQYSVWKQMKSFVGPQDTQDGRIVWIVGDTFVHLAQERASRCPYGTQLGFSSSRYRVFWFGRKGLAWPEMQKLITEAAGQAPEPDILIIHCGGEDLTKWNPFKLINSIKSDLKMWLVRWPMLKVVWSNIIKLKFWKYCDNHVVLSRYAKDINQSIRRFLFLKGGSVLRHEINLNCKDHYSSNGRKLSDIGLDIFNKSLQNMLENFES